jgi:hypothetical protein
MDPNVAAKGRGNLRVVKAFGGDLSRCGSPFEAVGDEIVSGLQQVTVLWILFSVFAIQAPKLLDIAQIHGGVHGTDHVVLLKNSFVRRRDGMGVRELGVGIVGGVWPSKCDFACRRRSGRWRR